MSDYMHIHRTQDQIAADRQRYLDFQREGMEAKTLPQPSPRPAPEAPNARLTEKVPGAWYTTLHLKAGEVLRLVPGGASGQVRALVDRRVLVFVVRQVPSHPRFDAELAARASLPGVDLYVGMPELATSVPLQDATDRHAPIDTLFRSLAQTGQMTYVDTWGAFCSGTRCETRGGLASDHISSTRLSPSGALALAPKLAADLARALTHAPYRRRLLDS
ncbi:MAG: SGNH hydrolase domain-containing protein [Proteobacteria bacterium]|nr:SGNH hydrolase domain-containing protein [Pseudomonadota bacterium]